MANNIMHVREASHHFKLPYTIPIKVLYMSNNNVKDWGEFQKLAELHQLDLLFVGKPFNYYN